MKTEDATFDTWSLCRCFKIPEPLADSVAPLSFLLQTFAVGKRCKNGCSSRRKVCQSLLGLCGKLRILLLVLENRGLWGFCIWTPLPPKKSKRSTIVIFFLIFNFNANIIEAIRVLTPRFHWGSSGNVGPIMFMTVWWGCDWPGD